MSKWLDAISDLRKSEIAPPPAGWKTAAEIAKDIGLKISAAGALIRRLVAAGKAERRKFPVLGAKGVRRYCNFYRLK